MRPADCHPEKPHVARGLCRVCHARKTGRAEAAYMRGDVLEWLAFLRDVGVDPTSLVKFESALLPAGTVAA